MAGSTLDPDNFPRRSGTRGPQGHDVGSLGPSDTSDSGSDLQGPGLVDDDRLNLERGTNEDVEGGGGDIADTGSAIGDREMDADSDSRGTGEHLTAGKDPRVVVDGDRGFDRVVEASEAGLGGGLDEAEEADVDPVGKPRPTKRK